MSESTFGKLEQKVMPCRGGIIRFGMTGMGNTQYAERFSSCESPFQDEKYGKGMRLHNAQGSHGSNSGKKAIGNYRCTVCGNGYGMVRP